jgi:Fanconi-associated nuclease 1
MIEDGAATLGKMKQYDKEAQILKMLLEQNTYRLGKRGAWYDRLALIQMYHLRTGKRRLHQKAALETCITAIRDPKVHLSKFAIMQDPA